MKKKEAEYQVDVGSLVTLTEDHSKIIEGLMENVHRAKEVAAMMSEQAVLKNHEIFNEVRAIIPALKGWRFATHKTDQGRIEIHIYGQGKEAR